MASLAIRNLLHDKIRLAVTLIGIVFAVVLMAVQLGLFLGFTATTSTIIDHAGANLWIAARGTAYFEVAASFDDRKYYQALATPGVSAAARYIVRFASWKRPDGAEENVEIIGFNTESGLGGPWSLAAGRAADLKNPDAVFIDDSYREKLGAPALGHVAEINGRRARVSGFTAGVRSFTTSPFVFTSLANAERYTGLDSGRINYILIKTAPGADPAAVKARLAATLTGVDVYTAAEFSRKTQNYWMFGTGAGVALLVAALMGLVVGVVVVGQTIYATTVDHLSDFGTLKAIGASNAYVHAIIMKQAVISAIVGYGLGMPLSLLVADLSRGHGAMIELPWQLTAGIFVLALVMCLTASLISVNRVTRVDPALVFKA